MKKIIFVLLVIQSVLIFVSCEDEKNYSVVIPAFFNESRNKEIDYLGLGLADEFVRKLSISKRLRVYSLDSLFKKAALYQAMGNDTEEKKILAKARDLKSDFVILGRYQLKPEHNILSLSVKIMSAKDSKIVASVTESGVLKEWNEKREILLSKIAQKIGIPLDDHEKRMIRESFTKKFMAFKNNYIGLSNYYKSLEMQVKNKIDEMEELMWKASFYFRKAIEIDQLYLLARLNLGLKGFISYSQEHLRVVRTQGRLSLMTIFGFKENSTNWDALKWVNSNGGENTINGMINRLPQGFKLEIQGYSNSAESDISLDRAKSVYKELVKIGVKPRRMTIKGFGPEKKIPWTKDSDVTNRRVVFKIVPIR